MVEVCVKCCTGSGAIGSVDVSTTAGSCHGVFEVAVVIGDRTWCTVCVVHSISVVSVCDKGLPLSPDVEVHSVLGPT